MICVSWLVIKVKWQLQVVYLAGHKNSSNANGGGAASPVCASVKTCVQYKGKLCILLPFESRVCMLQKQAKTATEQCTPQP
jgi:hypothetical protein